MSKRPCRTCGGYFDPDNITTKINKQYCSKGCQNDDIYSSDYSPLPLPDLREGNCIGLDGKQFTAGNGSIPPQVQRMCSGCPVVQACGEYGIRVAVEGIWGGMNNKTRANIAKNKGIQRETLTFDYMLHTQYTRREVEEVG